MGNSEANQMHLLPIDFSISFDQFGKQVLSHMCLFNLDAQHLIAAFVGLLQVGDVLSAEGFTYIF